MFGGGSGGFGSGGQNGFPRGNGGQVADFVAHLHDNGLRAVVENEIGHLQTAIVGDGLVERALGERHGIRLELNQHHGAGVKVVDNGVATLADTADLDSHLDPDKTGGIQKIPHQTVEEILAYPFFGGEPHIASAPLAEYLFLIVLYAGFQSITLCFAPAKVVQILQIRKSSAIGGLFREATVDGVGAVRGLYI